MVLEVGFEGGDILLGIEAEEEGLGRHEARAERDVERVLDEGHGLILGEEAVDRGFIFATIDRLEENVASTLLVADDLIEVSGELQEGQERRGKPFLHDLDLLNAIATDDVHLSSTA